MDHRATLERLTDTILDGGNDFLQLRDATVELHKLCAAIAGLSDSTDQAEADRETRLDHGRALSPRDAARCILDFARTAAYLRGAHDAVVEAQKRFPDTRIDLLYAGCGPFAPLALPLATRFDPAELGMTLLDIHPFSIDSVGRLASSFGITDSISACVCDDAAGYTHPQNDDLHIVVIETMQKALAHEPQIALTLALAPQLTADGILIPERIRLTACTADLSREFTVLPADADPEEVPVEPDRRRTKIGEVFELSADRLSDWEAANTSDERTLMKILEVPRGVEKTQNLMVRTTIDVFSDHRLDDYQSGLTHPTVFHELGSMTPGERLEFTYELGSSPVLRVRRAATP